MNNVHDFINRMDKDHQQRKFNNRLLNDLNESGDILKLKRLKKLSKITQIIKNNPDKD